ncbi:MAG TPA: orotate phosphoribosyltransferase [Thermoplasmatales archaeon]|nr:orotate phosphoribosyltransferase [Thermoplasmatales archaeon]
MELMGLCSVCGKPGACFTCHLCGRIVCRDCFDPVHGICVSCRQHKSY